MLAADLWVGTIWSSNVGSHGQAFYRKVFLLIVGGGISMMVFTTIRVNLISVGASGRIFDQMLANVFYLPLSFFESVPSGRIINRFSADTDKIDQLLPHNLESVLKQYGYALVILLLIVSSLPPMLLVLLPMGYLYYRIANYYRPAARDNQRLESLTRTPIFNRFQETLNGVNCIKAFGDAPRFLAEINALVDGNQTAFWSMKMTERWLGVWLEILSQTVVFLSAAVACAVRDTYAFADDGERATYASWAGVVLAYAFQVLTS